jgi:hypothetical protein
MLALLHTFAISTDYIVRVAGGLKINKDVVFFAKPKKYPSTNLQSYDYFPRYRPKQTLGDSVD